MARQHIDEKCITKQDPRFPDDLIVEGHNITEAVRTLLNEE